MRSSGHINCTRRAWKTTCPNCKKDVFYWECIHGSRVFFEYPIYGKLIKHVCESIPTSIAQLQIKKINQLIVLNRKQDLQATSSNNTHKNNISYMWKPHPKCPVCNKIFKNKMDLNQHRKACKH